MKKYQVSFQLQSHYEILQELGSDLLEIIIFDFLSDDENISELQIVDLSTESKIEIKTE
jgi:hypothetical protein